jgi:hypothetical protein
MSDMVHYLMPYVIAGLAIDAAGGVAYGSGAVGVAGFYLAVVVATAIAGVGYVRWESRDAGHRSR